MRISIIKIILFAFLINSNLWSGQDSSYSEIKKVNFKIGMNANYLFKSVDMQSGLSGVGLLFELHFTSQYSLVVLFNTLNINEKSDSPYPYIPDFSDYEINVKLRYRKILNRISLFPELGLGSWGRGIPIFIIGGGLEFDLRRALFAAVTLDYNGVCERCFDVGGGGYTNSFYRINFSINYLITIREKKKETKP